MCGGEARLIFGAERPFISRCEQFPTRWYVDKLKLPLVLVVLITQRDSVR